jgi:hypothetical protein
MMAGMFGVDTRKPGVVANMLFYRIEKRSEACCLGKRQSA